MRFSSIVVRLLTALILVAAIAGACNRTEQSTGNTPSPEANGAKEQYSAPRWPSYFKPPKSIDDLMPAARALVRKPDPIEWDEASAKLAAQAAASEPAVEEDGSCLTAH